MGLEVASFLNDLNTANPAGGDGKSQGDDHLRLLKTVLKATFPLAVGVREFSDVDAGATDTLIWNLWRNSASPAANDLLAGYGIEGNSSTAVKRQMLLLEGRIDSAVNGAEVASWLIKAMSAGVLTTGATINAVGMNGTLGGTTPAPIFGTTAILTGVAELQNALTIVGPLGGGTEGTLARQGPTNMISISGGISRVSGAAILLRGPSNASPNLIQFLHDNVVSGSISAAGNWTINGTLTVTG